MRPILQISTLLILAGIALFFALGNIFYTARNFELLAVVVVLTSVVVLIGGLQCWLIPLPARRKRSSFEIGWQVCGVFSLFLHAFLSILLLSLIFFYLRVNAPYRVDFESLDVASSKVQSGLLPSGVQYSVAQSPYKRDRFSVVLRVHVGSLCEPTGQAGLAHLAEHLSLDQPQSSDEVPTSLLSQFQALGAKIQTYTTYRSTFFVFSDMPFSTAILNRLLTLLHTMALSQAVSDDELLVERGIMRGEERLFNSTAALVQRRILCHHFGWQSGICQRFPFAEVTEAAAPTLSLLELEDFFQRFYQPARMHLYMSGDFELLQVEHALQSTWATAARPVSLSSAKEPSRAKSRDHLHARASALADVQRNRSGLTDCAVNLQRAEGTLFDC